MADTYDIPEDFGKGEKGEVRRWLMELSMADKREDEWRKLGNKILDRYRGKDRKANSFNILWSNTETLAPAIFNSPPKPNVARRYKDEDPIGKVTSKMLERALEFQTGNEEFMQALGLDVMDTLLPGRGVSRVRYVPVMAGADGDESVQFEQCKLEHVQWDDYRQGAGKTWAEVMWVGFRHRMDRDELCEKFGDEIGNAITLDEPDDDDLKKEEDLLSTFRTAEIWELWDKEEKQVLFIAKSYKDRFCKKVADPLDLTNFYPNPRPLYAINDASSLVPTPLFEQYKEQARELDRISVRINKIVDNMKLRGFYDATMSELKNLMDAEDNQLVPIQNAQQWLDKGMDKAIWMMDIMPAANALKVLYEQREATKQVIYELTGISDIRRGATDANETLGAQKLKAEFGSQRVNNMTREVQRYACDVIKIMAEISAEKFQPETLMRMTNMQLPTDEQVAMQTQQYQMAAQQAQAAQQQPPPAPPKPDATIDQVMALLHDDIGLAFRIDVETDSMIAATQQDDAQALQQVLTGVTQFIEGVAPAVQDGAFPVEAVKEIVMTICRRARMGTAVEDALNKIQAPKPPADPNAGQAQIEQAKLQGTMQMEQMKAQLSDQQHQREMQYKAQADEADGQRTMQLEQWKQQMQAAQVQHQNELEAQRELQAAQLSAQLEAQKQQHDAMLKQTELDYKKWSDELKASTSIAVAEIAAKSSMDKTLIGAEHSANEKVTADVGTAQLVKSISALVEHLGKPKIGTLSNGKQIRIETAGPDGKSVGLQ